MSLLSCKYLQVQSSHIRYIEAMVVTYSKNLFETYSILRAAKSPMEGGKRPSSTLADKSLH